MIYDICSVNDAMSWLACAVEIKNRETLSRALNARQEIHKRLLDDNREVAEHFFFVSERVLNIVKSDIKE